VPQPPHRTPVGYDPRRRSTDLASARRGHDTGGGPRDRSEETPRLTASDVLTVGDVAELLHVPESTVGDWARRQVIPSLKLGRRRIFIRSKIEAILLADRSQAND
jgi:excisionase family DNA binding protein